MGLRCEPFVGEIIDEGEIGLDGLGQWEKGGP